MSPIKVLFVCMGNICRSPSGEGVFKHFVNERGLNSAFHVDSAGTIGYHAGSPADARMRAAAEKRGYQLLSISRQVTNEDFEVFDLIVAMDADNLRDLESLAGGPRDYIRMLGSFLPGVGGNHDAPSVPDPYYGGDAGFEQVLDMIEQACDGLLAHCVNLAKDQLDRGL